MKRLTYIKPHIILKGVIIVALVVICGRAWASTPISKIKSTPSKIVKFNFRELSAVLEHNYMSNQMSLSCLDTILKQSPLVEQVDSLIVVATTSPDGSWYFNSELVQNRADSIKAYITKRHPSLDSDKIKVNPIVSNWKDIIPFVKSDKKAPYRRDILDILSHQSSKSPTEHRLRQLGGGEAWSYIKANYLPLFRSGSVTIATHEELNDTAKQLIDSHKRITRPIALKTNLLFDAITALNLEIELPISKKWSIAGEYTFPWWLDEKRQNCLQVMAANLEVRYWFKPNYKKQEPSLGKHNPLTGWFAGIYGGGGYYDIEFESKGYQGKLFIATGISGGYVQPLSHNLSMEYSVGVGYMKTIYHHYQVIQEDGERWLIHQDRGIFTWVGPTRAKISLVWYPNFKPKERRERR